LLAELPTGLDETYRRLLERIPPFEASLVRRVLSWTIYSFEGLSIKQLIDATAIEFGAHTFDQDCKVDEDTIRSTCSSLLRRVAGDRLEIAHFTVQEYLQKVDADDPKIGKFRIDEKHARATLGGVCLTYLCLPDFEQPPPATIQKREDRNKSYPFYEHAAKFWPGYTRHCWEDEKILCLSRRLFKPQKSYCFIAFFIEYVALLLECYTLEEIRWHELVGKIASGGLGSLHVASMMRLPALCRYLIDEGCDVNQISAIGTPLQLTIFDVEDLFIDGPCYIGERYWEVEDEGGIYDTVTILVDAGATCQLLNSKADCSLSLLAFSSDLGQSGVFRRLLDSRMQIGPDLLNWLERQDKATTQKFFDALNGATLTHLRPRTKTHLLNIATRTGSNAPPVLLSGNLDTEATPDEHYHLSVYHAIQFDQPDELKRLIADPRFRNDMHLQHLDQRPLHLAAKSRSLQVIPLLLDTDASEESAMVKVSGMTAWHLAARFGGKAMLDLLIAKFGTDAPGMTAKSDTGTSPLLEAILGGDQDSALHLLEINRPSSCDPGNLHVIHLSTTFGMRELIDRLIEKDFDHNVTSLDGENALFFVSHMTTPELIEDLMSRGLCPEATRSDGKTPLHLILSLEKKQNLHMPNGSSFANDGVLKKLISRPVLRMTDEKGNDPWYYYCTAYLQKFGLTESCEKLCKMLIENDALIAHDEITGKSAISLLVRNLLDAIATSVKNRVPAPQSAAISRASRLFRLCFDHPQALQSFLGDNESIRLLNWSIVENERTLSDILLEKGVDVHARCAYHNENSALDTASSGTLRDN
jgi:ankyrin repeat protein